MDHKIEDLPQESKTQATHYYNLNNLNEYCQIDDSPLISSRAEFERYGSTTDVNSAQSYLRQTFNVTSNNPVTLDMVQVRVCYIIYMYNSEDV